MVTHRQIGLKFSDLVILGELQELCEKFTEVTGAVTAILDLEGNILVASGWQEVCTRFHRQHPETAARCRESDTVLASQISRGQQYNIYRCKNGLADVAVPIIIGGEHIANFFTGQFFLEKPDLDHFSREAEALGINQADYLEALSRVPIFSEAQVHSIMGFFTRLAGLIGNMAYDRARLETANRELSDSRHLLQSVIDTVPMRVFWKDKDLRYLGCNPAFAQDAGKATPAEVIGSDDFQMAWSSQAETYRHDDMAIMATGIAKLFYDEQVTMRDGRISWVRTAKVPLLSRTHETIGLLGIYEDVTDRKQAEIELKLYHEHLEDLVSSRTTELAHANDSLRQTVEQLKHTQDELIQAERLTALGAIVAGVSHELNTPLGNAITMVSAMQAHLRQLRTAFDHGDLKRSMLEKYLEDTGEELELVARSLDRADTLVQSFKQTAIDQTSEQRRKFDLQQVVSDTITVLRTRYKDKPWQITIDVAPDIQLNSFPGPLEQVILNLVMNSINHGFDGRDHGRIKITGRLVAEGNGKEVLLTVDDDGIGIAPEYIDRVFDPFFTTKLGKGGSGIGLNLVHRMVNRILGGQVKLHSTEGVGTTFTIRIPTKAPDRI